MSHLRPALLIVGLFAALLGVAMPLAITGIGQAVFPSQANGSLVRVDGRIVGSELIAQPFADPRYFQPRPSAVDYKGEASGASNLAPTSGPLLAAVRERAEAHGPAPVPADAAYASGSGLDPHISPENAARQTPRVAAARGLPEARLATLVAEHTEGRALGFIGEPRVNVLRLNLALDASR
jgi:potassium-transporting ATPase KdpC subunit